MSHLSRPRIHFQGELFANVTTANNDDVIQDLVDVASVTVRNPKEIFNQAIQKRLVEEGISSSLEAASDDKNTFQINTIIDDEFRQRASRDPKTGTVRAAGWNYCGDARCWFENVTVTGVELPGLPLITKKFNDSDPLIGAAVNLNEAIMVDVDPEGILSTQIFCHQFRISHGDSLLFEGNPAPFYARWHYSWRNLAFLESFKGASAVWQAGIPGNTLCFGKTESDLLRALAVEMPKWQGLFVRFCTYFFTRPDEPNDKGNYAAYGRILGTIGPWYNDEMASVTTGRLLYPVGRLSHNGRPFKLGPAVAKIDETNKQDPVIVLDLITTFPERDRTLEKIDCGEVSLQLQYSQQGRVHTETLGEPISYHRQAYEKRGGIVEVKCPQELKRFLPEGRLQLFFNEAGHCKLVEVDLAVETDERGIYLQKGDDKGKTIEFRVFRKGKTTNEAIAIKLEQYVTTNFKGNPPIPAEPAPSILHIVDMIPNKEKPYEISVDSDGKACLTLKPKKAGTCIIRFVPTEQPGGQFNLTFGTSFFLNVRVLPEDNYENDERFEKGKKLEFKDIYNEILRYYHLLYPGVGHSFKFDNEEQVRDHAKEIIERISKDPHSAKYMPITRELSKGKRELLERWCAQVIEEEEGGKYSSSAKEV
jgi:hypothetical protein